MEKHELSDPKATYILSIWIFADLFFVVIAYSFLDSVPIFGFLSKLYVCMTSHFKLFHLMKVEL